MVPYASGMKAKIKAIWKTVEDPVLFVLALIAFIFFAYIYGHLLVYLFPRIASGEAY